MKKLFLISVIVLGLTVAPNQTNAQPTITSFTPMVGSIGTTVTITGTNFNSTAVNNIVFFGATQATVSSASSTSLTITVPAGSTYQNISVTDLTSNLSAYSTQPFIVTFVCGAPMDTNSFAIRTDFTTGDHPQCVSIGDLDGDGKPDLAAVNQLSGTVSVLKNTSVIDTILFASRIDYTTGGWPAFVTINDLDGDGKSDLIVANAAGNSVSVFRNTSITITGTISFAPKVDFTTGQDPYCVVVSDLDGDGKPDLITTNNASGNISIFKNTSTSGVISFAARIDFTAGLGPQYASTCDLDGDGKPDIAVTNYGNTLSILRNTSTSGVISLDTSIDYGTGFYPQNVFTGDLDGDGKPDIALANFNSHTVSVYKNTSIVSSISFAPKIDYTMDGPTKCVSIGDIDGDGKLDLVVGAGGPSGTYLVSVLLNISTSGTISFASKIDYHVNASPAFIAIGDLDGDGKPDLTTANGNFNSVLALMNVLCTPLGIVSNTEFTSVVSIFPNPLTTQATLRTNIFLKNATLTIDNSFGQTVNQIKNISGQINILYHDNLPSGLYYLRLVEDNKIFSVNKLVILNN